MTAKEERVNFILLKWNPLDVPEFIAEDEYRSYVNSIIAVGENAGDLKSLLIKLLEEFLGIEFDEGNEDHQRDVEGVAKELATVFQL